jgi:hypothetical protein
LFFKESNIVDKLSEKNLNVNETFKCLQCNNERQRLDMLASDLKSENQNYKISYENSHIAKKTSVPSAKVTNGPKKAQHSICVLVFLFLYASIYFVLLVIELYFPNLSFLRRLNVF